MIAATVVQVLQDLSCVLLHVLFYLWSLLKRVKTRCNRGTGVTAYRYDNQVELQRVRLNNNCNLPIFSERYFKCTENAQLEKTRWEKAATVTRTFPRQPVT